MFSSVPLRSARIYTSTHPFLSLLFTLILDNCKVCLYVNLMCFDRISSKDNLVQKSGAVRQAFFVCVLQVYMLRKSARQTSE